MNNLPLASLTEQRLTAYVKSPSSALMIHGPSGSGAFFVAQKIAASLLGVNPDNLNTHPYALIIEREEGKSEISIAQVRAVLSELAKTTPGNGLIRRIVVFKDAQHMNREAQNALLKSLEEPPSDTALLFTVSHTSDLLPTVRSRLQHFKVEPLTIQESESFFSEAFDDAEIQRAWQLSGGRARLIAELLGSKEHPLNRAIEVAKQFISSDTFSRIRLSEELSKDKLYANEFLEALSVLAKTLQRRRQPEQKSKKILKIQKETVIAKDAVDANTQLKLVFLRLATHI